MLSLDICDDVCVRMDCIFDLVFLIEVVEGFVFLFLRFLVELCEVFLCMGLVFRVLLLEGV